MSCRALATRTRCRCHFGGCGLPLPLTLHLPLCQLQAAVQSEFWRVQRRQLAVSLTEPKVASKVYVQEGDSVCCEQLLMLLHHCLTCADTYNKL